MFLRRVLKALPLVLVVAGVAASSTGCGTCCSLCLGGATATASTVRATPAEVAPTFATTSQAQAH